MRWKCRVVKSCNHNLKHYLLHHDTFVRNTNELNYDRSKTIKDILIECWKVTEFKERMQLNSQKNLTKNILKIKIVIFIHNARLLFLLFLIYLKCLLTLNTQEPDLCIQVILLLAIVSFVKKKLLAWFSSLYLFSSSSNSLFVDLPTLGAQRK